MQHPRSPVCQDRHLTHLHHVDPSVSRSVATPDPKPATWGFTNFGNETGRKSFTQTLRLQVSAGKFWLHDKLCLLCHASGCFNAAEAFSF